MTPGYREEGGYTLIELRLEDVRQLFDNRDPAPFRRRDLDPDAAAYIVEAAAEQAPGVVPKLLVHLPPSGHAAAGATEVAEAVQAHFAWQAQLAQRHLRDLLATGRVTFLAGLLFMALCSGLALGVGGLGLGWAGEVLEEGLIIIGWVALWRPAEIFLYEWWPLRRRRRQMAGLAAMPVEVRAGLGGR
jgi:hypothetical protein